MMTAGSKSLEGPARGSTGRARASQASPVDEPAAASSEQRAIDTGAPGAAEGAGGQEPSARDDRDHHDQSAPRRVLIVDDSPSIHADFREILAPRRTDSLAELDELLFGDDAPVAPEAPTTEFALDFAYQGQEALTMVEAATGEGRPYAVCFLDVRMPPGWSGPETLAHLWRVDPNLQVVLCTAYADLSWQSLLASFARTDGLLILKKPFEVPEVRQMAYALSEKWLLAEADRRRVSELEARVRRRTRALDTANEQLRHEMHERVRAQHELSKRQRLESLGRLAAGLGHEINNPLNCIAGNVEWVLEELAGRDAQAPTAGATRPAEAVASPADIERALRDTLQSAARIARVVRSVSAFMQPVSDTLEPLSVNQLITDAAEAVLAARRPADSGERGAPDPSTPGPATPAATPVTINPVTIDLALGEVPAVLARRRELKQVFVNLIENAVCALAESAPPAGSAVRVVSRYEGDQRVHIEVIDAGVGIADDHLDKIFDPFFTTRPVGEGMGLGLSVCHATVTSLGGTITVRPGAERGAVAAVTLPALAVSEADRVASQGQRRLERDRPPAGQADAPPGPARVLVVDDEPLIRTILQQVLKGHHVRLAVNGREALAECLAAEFDVIFCDLMMPEVTGMEFHRALSATHPDRAARVVFITGGSRLEDVQRFLAEVPNQCLEKPIENRRIRDIVHRHVTQGAA
ncbi:MAG: hypothetical protein Tsb0020_13030 [Haliangiales bacterium]